MDNDFLIKATLEDVAEIYELIKKRIQWMNEKNIAQWNKTNYLESYPKAYFEEKAVSGQLYVLKDETFEKVTGAVVLLDEDKRWIDDGSKSYYIHNLVSDTEVPGVGTRIIQLCEKMAITEGKDKLRLDCQESNLKLNGFYNNLGFKYVEKVQEGSYVGNKREKCVNTIFPKYQN